ncbi:hypothetical protein AKJ16_DCAP20158, partial [Drosera capensis]
SGVIPKQKTTADGNVDRLLRIPAGRSQHSIQHQPLRFSDADSSLTDIFFTLHKSPLTVRFHPSEKFSVSENPINAAVRRLGGFARRNCDAGTG